MLLTILFFLAPFSVQHLSFLRGTFRSRLGLASMKWNGPIKIIHYSKHFLFVLDTNFFEQS